MLAINEFSKEVFENAQEHGWWEEERRFGEIIALCHSELSEALEEGQTRQSDRLFFERRENRNRLIEMERRKVRGCSDRNG